MLTAEEFKQQIIKLHNDQSKKYFRDIIWKYEV